MACFAGIKIVTFLPAKCCETPVNRPSSPFATAEGLLSPSPISDRDMYGVAEEGERESDEAISASRRRKSSFSGRTLLKVSLSVLLGINHRFFLINNVPVSCISAQRSSEILRHREPASLSFEKTSRRTSYEKQSSRRRHLLSLVLFLRFEKKTIS